MFEHSQKYTQLSAGVKNTQWTSLTYGYLLEIVWGCI